ncbi:unnamed protein product [Cochlearia groenlandica]
MAGQVFIKTLTFLVLVYIAVVVSAEDYDVGDDTEWTRPAGIDFYTTWAARKTFRVGDELEFEFAAGRHDVAEVTKEAYEKCDKAKPISHMTMSPVKIMLNITGPRYFICTVADHCRFGQKLAIDVVGATAGATPGATPAGTTTTTTTTTKPSSGNVVSSLSGVTFLVGFVYVIVALF